jgi:hypothetical protein
MSSKYIPPALRNKASVPPVPSANEFPSLGSARGSPNTTWKHKTSFAVLASEWREQSEEDAEKREIQQATERREAERRAAEERMIVHHRKRHIDEIYEMEEDYEDDTMWAQTTARTNEDGWTTVERKAKKELTLEETILREQKREEEEKRAQAERDSVWDASANNDWDYRDRRAVA